MARTCNSRKDTFLGISNLISEVKNRTLNGFTLSNVVFRGTKNGQEVPLCEEYGVSGENNLNIFVLSGLLEVQNKKGYKGSKYIKWCGPKISLKEMTEYFILVRNEYKAKRLKKSKKNTVKSLPVQSVTPTPGAISKDEFIQNIYAGPKPGSVDDVFGILNELYKKSVGNQLTHHQVFKGMIPDENGVLQKGDIRDMYQYRDKRNRRNSIVTIPILIELGIYKEVNGKLSWVGGSPTKAMALEVCKESGYRNYIVKERNAKPVVVETPQAAPVEEKHFPGTMVVNKKDEPQTEVEEKPEFVSIDKMSDSQLLRFVAKQQVRNIEFQTELSKNLGLLISLFEKAVRGE